MLKTRSWQEGAIMKIFTSTNNLGIRDMRVAFKALNDFLEIFLVSCEGKFIPDECTVRIELQDTHYSMNNLNDGSLFLVRFVCPLVGSYAVRIFHWVNDYNPYSTFYVVGDEAPATPLRIFDAIFGQAMRELAQQALAK